MVFLANEGTFAVLGMTVALVVALVGVFALGAYVLHCDRQNRLGESEFAGAAEPLVALGHDHVEPVGAIPAREAQAEVVVPAVVVDPPAEAAAPVITRPRRARPPQGH